MLILTRKEKESIIINGNIKVTILNIKGRAAFVGIDAPKEIPILREELKGREKSISIQYKKSKIDV